MSDWTLYLWLITTILVLGWMTFLFVINVLKKNIGIVDVGWGIGFILVASVFFFLNEGMLFRKQLILGLIILWGGRLSIHLLIRFLKKKEEDLRYYNLRKKYLTNEVKIFLLFMGQGLLILIISLPLFAITSDTSPIITPIEWMGITLSFFSILGETIADWQLAKFKNQRKGLCREGLWNRSRHPNYFFEWLFWVGIALFALPAPFGLVGIASCGIMLYLLLFLSGIPATERCLVETKGLAYSQYQKHVPGFFPKLRAPKCINSR
ncbi:DUF1295 domain-containing protein [Chlamydiales bacterium]|nr:DUF1295 domain-containing protein [Chlamydiales bacterium]